MTSWKAPFLMRYIFKWLFCKPVIFIFGGVGWKTFLISLAFSGWEGNLAWVATLHVSFREGNGKLQLFGNDHDMSPTCQLGTASWKGFKPSNGSDLAKIDIMVAGDFMVLRNNRRIVPSFQPGLFRE